jgi:hypothetical protein
MFQKTNFFIYFTTEPAEKSEVPDPCVIGGDLLILLALV